LERKNASKYESTDIAIYSQILVNKSCFHHVYDSFNSAAKFQPLDNWRMSSSLTSVLTAFDQSVFLWWLAQLEHRVTFTLYFSFWSTPNANACIRLV